jgi:hypothetical protein
LVVAARRGARQHPPAPLRLRQIPVILHLALLQLRQAEVEDLDEIRVTVTLDQNLTLTDDLYLLRGGSIARTSQTISADAFVVDDASFDLLAGDTFSGGYTNYVRDGGLVNAPAGTSLHDLNVYDTNGNGDPSLFNVNGDVSLGIAHVYGDGVINLNTGTLSAESLYLSGTAALNQNGGNYSIDDLSSAGAALRYGLEIQRGRFDEPPPAAWVWFTSNRHAETLGSIDDLDRRPSLFQYTWNQDDWAERQKLKAVPEWQFRGYDASGSDLQIFDAQPDAPIDDMVAFFETVWPE